MTPISDIQRGGAFSSLNAEIGGWYEYDDFRQARRFYAYDSDSIFGRIGAYYFGPPGKRVQVILPDNRIAQAPTEQNFGRITIDWNGSDTLVTMEVEVIDGSIRISQKLRLSELRQNKC